MPEDPGIVEDASDESDASRDGEPLSLYEYSDSRFAVDEESRAPALGPSASAIAKEACLLVNEMMNRKKVRGRAEHSQRDER